MARSSRWFALSGSTVLAVGVCAAVWWRAREEPAGLVFNRVENAEQVRAERLESGAERATPLLTRDPTERLYYLTEAQAGDLFDLDPAHRKGNVFDPWCFYRRKGGVDGTIDWDEHPAGAIRVLTNSEGLADDEVDRETPRDLRVLVAGDSHTFGVCSPQETYANVLERDLRDSWPNRSVDVLNTGQGGFTFYQYLGMLEKYLDWQPDVFVLGVYAGNDFTELVGLAHVFDEGPSVGLSEDEVAARALATRSNRNRYAIGQCFNAAYVFKCKPAHRQRALDRSLALVERMREVCDASGVHFVVAVIPAPCGMDWPDPVRTFEKVKRALDLSDEDCAVVDILGRRFARGVSALGITVVDMTERFHGLAHPPYWRKDQHLNLVGHEELARALLPVIEEWAIGAGRLPDR